MEPWGPIYNFNFNVLKKRTWDIFYTLNVLEFEKKEAKNQR
jgi:hypothetical protein